MSIERHKDLVEACGLRIVERKDIPAISDISAHAFSACNYPFPCQFIDGEARKLSLSKTLFQLMYQGVLKHGYIIADEQLHSCIAIKPLHSKPSLPYLSTALKVIGKMRIKELISLVRASDLLEKHAKFAFASLPDNALYFEALAVDPRRQRNGYARKLLKSQLAYAEKSRQAVAFYTHTADNEVYYKKFGMQTVHVMTDQRYGHTIYFMVKKFE